jgi:hypothetical protein
VHIHCSASSSSQSKYSSTAVFLPSTSKVRSKPCPIYVKLNVGLTVTRRKDFKSAADISKEADHFPDHW